MAWHAKPKGGYQVGTDEWRENILEFANFAKMLGYSVEAISGMAGNSQGEGGMNPWRWQSDSYDLDMGYGLFQYTPASGYINNYGKRSQWYAPNLSTSTVTTGALPTDGNAQIEAVEYSGKYAGSSVRVKRIKGYYSECEKYTNLSEFKAIKDVYGATVCWLGFFEAPKVIDQKVVDNRYSWAKAVYDVIKDSPQPPKPVDRKYMIVKIRKKRRMGF